ncbi:MAG TPA: response regulator transcription factor [Candidatus Hypogeohydataceae bacterium YC41]
MPKILIVDDDPDIVEAMRLPLEANNYQVVSASSAKEGLEKVLKERPGLVILDVMMETTTEGFHFAYKLRSESPDSPYKDFRTVPILMITAIHKVAPFRFSPREDESFLPVDDFIEKPIEPRALLEKVFHLLKK